MKFMNKITCFAVAMVLVFAAGLTGCGANNSGKEDENANVKASTQVEPEESNASEPIVLTVWGDPVHNGDAFKSNPSAEGKNILDTIQKKMQEKFPTIKIEYIDKGWADQLRQNLMIATMAGNPPDIADGEDFIPEFARIGALSEVPADIAKELSEGPISAAKYNGKLYAVSGVTGIFGLVYNKDVLVKAGLNENDVPKTWNQWLEVSKKITDAGKGQFYGTIVQNGQLGGAFRIAPFIRQLGGDFASSDWQNVTFNTPEIMKTLTFLRELSKTAPPGSTTLNDEGAIYKMINDGKACFYVNGPWFIGWTKSQNPPGNIGYAPLPVPDEGGKPANVIVGNVLWFTLKASKHQEAALEYLKIMAGADYQKKVSVMSGRIPSNKVAADDEEFKKSAPELSIFAQITANEQATALPVYPKNGPKIWEAWYKVQDITLVSDRPIDAALAEAQKKAEELLK